MAESLVDEEFYPDELLGGQTYYWRVTAVDIGGLRTDSPIWSFSTATDPVLCVSPLVWQPPGAGGIKHFEVTDCGTLNQSDYTVQVDATWLTGITSTFLTPGGFVVTAENNLTGFPRTAQITVTAAALLGSPKTISVAQESSIEPYIDVRNGFQGSPVTVRVHGLHYAIGDGKTVRIPLTETSTTLCIWECPYNQDCGWDCEYPVRVGQRYAVIQDALGPVNNLILVGD